MINYNIKPLLDRFKDDPEMQAKILFNSLNYNKNYTPSLNLEKSFLSVKLRYAFVWSSTPEGYNYWNNIHIKLLTEDIKEYPNPNVDSATKLFLLGKRVTTK